MTAQPRTLPRPVSFMQRRRRQLSRAPYPAPSPSCSSGDDSSAAHPTPPHLLRAAVATTAQPRALPHPFSFMWQQRRQLSRAPCPTPSPLCGDNNNSSAARPAPPRLLHVATMMTAQPRALSRPISFMRRRRRQLSCAPCPVSFVQQQQRQLSRAPCLAPSPLCGNDDNSSATCPVPPRLLHVATTTTAQPCALSRPISFMGGRRRQLRRVPGSVSSVKQRRLQL